MGEQNWKTRRVKNLVPVSTQWQLTQQVDNIIRTNSRQGDCHDGSHCHDGNKQLHGCLAKRVGVGAVESGLCCVVWSVLWCLRAEERGRISKLLRLFFRATF